MTTHARRPASCARPTHGTARRFGHLLSPLVLSPLIALAVAVSAAGPVGVAPPVQATRTQATRTQTTGAVVTGAVRPHGPSACALADRPFAAPAVRTIGEVQGQTLDGENGATDRSPFAPASGNGAGTEAVTVQGVVYATTLARTSGGGTNRGFFLQNTLTARDADPLTSDGIFVFTGSNTSLGTGTGAGCVAYTPSAGDELVVRGRVAEFFSLAQLSSGLCVVEVVRTGVDLETELETFEANPPSDPAEVARYWERHEGMRARVPTGSIVTGPTTVFASTADSEVRVINPTHPVAQRAEPYARRAFRDPHSLDDVTPPRFDNGNAYLILLGSQGIKGAANDDTLTIAPSARAFDTTSAPLVGGVYFAFDTYSIQVSEQPALTPGPDPSLNDPPRAPDRSQEHSVATFNGENLYDFRDDPFDGCDFVDNDGCTGVNPPFNYVPASDAEYQQRLGWLASQIVDDLKAPDILLIQEAEDQDVCTMTGRALVCGAADDADGKPDTLQELALRIQAGGGPVYDAAYDRDGADDRGIVSAFLFRTDRVELLPAQPTDPVLGNAPTVDYRGTPLAANADASNPKTLNALLPADVDRSTGTDGDNVFTRAPQVGLFRIFRSAVGTGDFVDAYLVSNHFSSNPNARVSQRREQALYNAAIFDALQAANPNVRVAVGGDFNVYPRPDDPFPDAPTDQLGPLYDAGLDSLYDALLAEDADSAYSYVFDHQAQVLDQLFVSGQLRAELAQVRVAHVNADWPRDFPADGPRGISDHDPSVARFMFPEPSDAAEPAPPEPATNPAPPEPVTTALATTMPPSNDGRALLPSILSGRGRRRLATGRAPAERGDEA